MGVSLNDPLLPNGKRSSALDRVGAPVRCNASRSTMVTADGPSGLTRRICVPKTTIPSPPPPPPPASCAYAALLNEASGNRAANEIARNVRIDIVLDTTNSAMPFPLEWLATGYQTVCCIE